MADWFLNNMPWLWFPLAVLSPFIVAFAGFFISEWRGRRRVRRNLHTLSRREYEHELWNRLRKDKHNG